MKRMKLKKEVYALKDAFIEYIEKYGFGEDEILNEILNTTFETLLYVQSEFKIDLGIREER